MLSSSDNRSRTHKANETITSGLHGLEGHECAFTSELSCYKGL